MALAALVLVSVGCERVAGAEGDEEALALALIRAVDGARVEFTDPGEGGVGELVPPLELSDLQGGTLSLAELAAGSEALVVAVQAGVEPPGGDPEEDYRAERLAELEREYAERGVAFLYVHLGAPPGAEVARREIEARGLRGRHAVDAEGKLGRALGIEASGLVLVLDRSRTLRYRGALDERWTGGVRRAVRGHDFVGAALEAVLAHRLVENPATRAEGAPVGMERVVPPIPEEVTFQREIARLFQARCVECHHAGGAGPFALDDYESAYDKRRMIRFVVEGGIMPPWFATEEPGTWRGDRRLSARELALLLAWVDAGAPAGDPAEAPTPLRWENDWSIGSPDLVFTLAEAQQIPAEGGIGYRTVPADLPVTEDLWIERLEVRPGDQSVVHHASVFFLPPRERGPAQPDPSPDHPERMRRAGGKELLWGYAPGRPAGTFDTGTARFVPQGSQIVFEMHYTPQGRDATDLTRLGVVLARGRTPLVVATQAMSFRGVDIRPGGRPEYSQEYEFEHALRLRSLTPHMHYRGDSFRADLLRADGRRQTLISIPAWDFGWQHTYQFRDGPYVQRGDRIRMTGRFDNTAANLDNPDPGARVPWGLESDDEMLLLGIEWEQPRAEGDAEPAAR